MLDLTHHPRVELVMYLSQIDHLDHAMTQTMANRPSKDGGQGRPILPGLLLSFVLLDNAGHLLVVNILFYFLFSC